MRVDPHAAAACEGSRRRQEGPQYDLAVETACTVGSSTKRWSTCARRRNDKKVYAPTRPDRPDTGRALDTVFRLDDHARWAKLGRCHGCCGLYEAAFRENEIDETVL